MLNQTDLTTFRVHRTQLAWRIPALSRSAAATPSAEPAAIGTAYTQTGLAISPAKALLAALAATTTLFVTVGALALPAAAFA